MNVYVCRFGDLIFSHVFSVLKFKRCIGGWLYDQVKQNGKKNDGFALYLREHAIIPVDVTFCLHYYGYLTPEGGK